MTATEPNPLASLIGTFTMLSIVAAIFFALTYDDWQRLDKAWWAAARRNVATVLYTIALAVLLLVAINFLTIPVLLFITRHWTAIWINALFYLIIGTYIFMPPGMTWWAR